MKLKSSLFYLCLCILAGCSNANVQNSPYLLNDQLSLSYQKTDDSLKYKRTKLLFSGNYEANDCNSYYDLASKYNLEESIHNQLVKSEYLICDALKILSESKGISDEKALRLDLGRELLSKLDIRSFPSSLSRAGSELSYTLKSLYPSQVSYIDNVAVFETQYWTFTMEVVALVRINDNSKTDWIVWVFDESKSGNYRGYSTIILYDPDEKEVFRAATSP